MESIVSFVFLRVLFLLLFEQHSDVLAIYAIFLQISYYNTMRFSTRRLKRQSRSKMSFPVVAIVRKKVKPHYFYLQDTKLKQEVNENSVKKRRIGKLPQGTIDYKNIVLLRKLISAEGKILPRRINKLTAKQQRHTAKAIKNARIMGLLPFINKSLPSG